MAFRGTENAQDGLQDMKIIRKNIDYLQALYPGVQAHTGEQVVPSAGGSNSLTSYQGHDMQGMVQVCMCTQVKRLVVVLAFKLSEPALVCFAKQPAGASGHVLIPCRCSGFLQQLSSCC